jgi:DNA-binding transcriptional LysR family regulator
MLDLRRLRVLREVAVRGSFSAAATALMFSPSAVSQQIAQLEREVGVTLVERRSTGVVLTPAGQLLLAHANAILARAADAEEELRQLSDGNLGRLRAAAFSSAAATLMPEAIVEFRAVQPRVEIELVEQDRRESLEQLRRGELDLAIVVRVAEPDPEGVVVMPLLDDYIDVLLPLHHRLAGSPAVALASCATSPGRTALASQFGSTWRRWGLSRTLSSKVIITGSSRGSSPPGWRSRSCLVWRSP